MNIVLFMLMLIPIIYIGEVLGLVIHCDICEYLEPAKPFVWKVPFMQIEMFWEHVKSSFEKKNLHPLRSYFTIKEKLIVLLCDLANKNVNA